MADKDTLAAVAEELRTNEKAREEFKNDPVKFLTERAEGGEMSDEMLEEVSGGIRDNYGRLKLNITFAREFVAKFNIQAETMW